jgi:hypothetical protein
LAGIQRIYGGIVSKFPGDEEQDDQGTLEKDIEIGGETFDDPYQEEVRHMEHASAIERLNSRISLLAILIPCLLGALVLYGYLDIKEHVNQVQNVGSTELKALSTNVVEEVASLSDRYNETITSLSDRIATLEASSVVIKQNLEKQKAEMKRIGGAKVDKAAMGKMEEQTAETIKTLEGLRNELNDQRVAVENLNKALEEEMAGLVRAVEGVSGHRKKQESNIENLYESKLDKKTFDDFLKKEQISYESEISPLKQEVDSLKEGMSQLQKQVNTLGRSIRLMEAEKSLLQRKPADQKAGSGPGKIIEQEISQ